MQPSTIYLSCQPNSRVYCMVQSPCVSFVVSFSLFSPQEIEGVSPSSYPLSVVTFNNLYVTGCLKTFSLQLLSPQISKLKSDDLESPKIEEKDVLGLTLGQATTHFSRKSVLCLPSKTSPVSSVDDYTSHSKLQVSGVYVCMYICIHYTCIQ